MDPVWTLITMCECLSVFEEFGRGEWIRTTDLLVPNQHLSTTYEHRSLKPKDLYVFFLDPIWTLKANVWRTGLPLDPAWTLVSTVVIHMPSRTRAVASAVRKLTKICCSDGILRSP